MLQALSCLALDRLHRVLPCTVFVVYLNLQPGWRHHSEIVLAGLVHWQTQASSRYGGPLYQLLSFLIESRTL